MPLHIGRVIALLRGQAELLHYVQSLKAVPECTAAAIRMEQQLLLAQQAWLPNTLEQQLQAILTNTAYAAQVEQAISTALNAPADFRGR